VYADKGNSPGEVVGYIVPGIDQFVPLSLTTDPATLDKLKVCNQQLMASEPLDEGCDQLLKEMGTNPGSFPPSTDGMTNAPDTLAGRHPQIRSVNGRVSPRPSSSAPSSPGADDLHICIRRGIATGVGPRRIRMSSTFRTSRLNKWRAPATLNARLIASATRRLRLPLRPAVTFLATVTIDTLRERRKAAGIGPFSEYLPGECREKQAEFDPGAEKYESLVHEPVAWCASSRSASGR
jgi:hypothetical protein